MTRRNLERRFRIVLGAFIVALVVSGLTAFPLLTEVRWAAEMLEVSSDASESPAEGVRYWIGFILQGLEESHAKYPFLAYGTDWLAFAHLVIALFFVGPLIRPTEYDWTLISGMIACGGVVLLAMICGPIRGIPLSWRLFDCAFGLVGFLPLAYCYALSRKLVQDRQ